MKRSLGIAVALALIAVGVAWTRLRSPSAGTTGAPGLALRDVGPRLVSNETSQPVALHGSGFAAGMSLHLGAPFDRTVPIKVIDPALAYARLPAGLTLPPEQVQAEVELRIVGPAGQSAPRTLTVVNDAAFHDFTTLAWAPGARRLFAASARTDTLLAIDADTYALTPLSAGDGPSALAVWRDPAGREWLVVAHAWTPALHLYPAAEAADRTEPRTLAAPSYATGIAVADEGVAYVAEHATDTVCAIDLRTGEALWRVDVAPNPRELVVLDAQLAVGSLQTGEIQLIDRRSGRLEADISPGPDTAIVGGGTDGFERAIMGGKAPRSMVWSRSVQRLFVASIGPNIGPNPERMEVSMNGGVGVISPASGTFDRHVGFGAGVTDALALDDARGLLYAADTALGIVRVLDVHRLVGTEAEAADAVVRTFEVTPPEDFPTLRPPRDFGIKGRAGLSLHSGPTAIVLGEGGAVHVLARFTGRLHTFDAAGGERSVALADTLAQRTRRLGQIAYYADVGRTAMSCDACHLDGHTEGVFFEKTRPMRIYRANTLRGSRETPPYFTPASTFSLAQTARDVGGRNRYHNPVPTAQEIEALAQFTAAITLLPNPHLGGDGAPPEVVKLPDGRSGRPLVGRRLFDARCARCHPAPHFTTDQDPATRGQYLDVGTPHALPLRVSEQELLFTRFAPPPLIGSWDVFPMLGTGSAGFAPGEDGRLRRTTRFPLREVLERYSGPAHGDAASLTDQERDDLIAWLISL